VPGYIGFRLHVVRRGDTLSEIAQANYGDPGRFRDIVRANPLVISDPNRISPARRSRYRYTDRRGTACRPWHRLRSRSALAWRGLSVSAP